MRKILSILWWGMAWSICSQAQEYVYPVAQLSIEGSTYVLVTYQNRYGSLELWLWDPETERADRALLSTYTPLAVNALPERDGFSFLDNDMVRIKMANRRSPRSVQWYEPLYDVQSVHWIDNETLYFSALSHERRGLYQATVDGQVEPLVTRACYDCLYPSAVGQHLFYIARDTERRSSICRAEIAPGLKVASYRDDQECSPEAVLAYLAQAGTPARRLVDQRHEEDAPAGEVLVKVDTRSIAFLTMFDEHEGMVIEHQASVNEWEDATIPFICHRLTDSPVDDAPGGDTAWHLQELFAFTIPIHYLIDTHDPEQPRLYESILPLLPRRQGKRIFFVSAAMHVGGAMNAQGRPSADTARSGCQDGLQVWSYDVTTRQCTQHLVASPGQDFFVPVAVDQKFFAGGSVAAPDAPGAQPGIWMDASGQTFISLARVSTA